jgi:hypothetical protein
MPSLLLASRDKRSFTHIEKTDLQNHTVMVFFLGGGGVEVNVCRIIFSVSTKIFEKLPPSKFLCTFCTLLLSPCRQTSAPPYSE